MSKIYILPDRISNRIAAGEVVERPASVVKELVENSLDAGATEISVTIQGDGKRLIQVSDDGSGMDHDDAIISLERHSTSKIKNADDLESIASLGFRGEALASIASVSRLTLNTRTEEESASTRVEVTGGKLVNVSRSTRERGTTIRVEDLFFNTPARLKFLKSGAIEMKWLIKYLTKYAIINPGVKFNLVSGQKNVIDAPPAKTIFERIYQIFGSQTAKLFLPFDSEQSDLRVYGYCSHTNHNRSSKDGLYFFINGRSVDDRILSVAVRSAYQNLLPSGKFPSVFLFLDTPLDFVDVNVHPTKAEVRFSSPGLVRSLIEEAIRAALLKSSPVLRMKTDDSQNRSVAESTSPEESPAQAKISRFLQEGISDSKIEEPQPREELYKDGSIESELLIEKQKVIPRSSAKTFDSPEPDQPGIRHTEISKQYPPTSDKSVDLLPDLSSVEPKLIGQLDNTFILVQIESDLLIIDQHVAHERIRYEQLHRQNENSKLESQHMLIPVTVDLDPAASSTMESLSVELEQFGFELEQFGNRTWVVKAVPIILETGIQQFLQEMIETAGELISSEKKDRINRMLTDEIITLLSCHGAIKRNTPLTKEKMIWLIDTLFKCDEPYRCPHGRPITIRIEKRELFIKFGRTPE